MHYTLCDMLSDLIQNSIEAQAQKVTVEFIESKTDLTVYIRDDGKGMSPETLKRVTDPFYTDGIKHPKRKVGLGIPFLIQTTTSTNGEWKIESKEHVGTTVFMRFDLTNIDTPPIGDVPGLFRHILTFPGNYEMEIIRKRSGEGTELDYQVLRSELLDALGSLEDVQSLVLLGQFLKDQEEEIE